MAIQQTLSIIKPDAVRKNNIGAITQRFEEAGLKVIAARMEKLTINQAKKFYQVHKERPFFNQLVDFICSGPIMIQVLEGPMQAEAGTIRADFAESIGQNAVHGSDSPETARQEVAFFFTQDQCFSEEL